MGAPTRTVETHPNAQFLCSEVAPEGGNYARPPALPVIAELPVLCVRTRAHRLVHVVWELVTPLPLPSSMRRQGVGAGLD